MNIIIKNLLVNYRRQGKGRTILLLHGWGDNLETFDDMCKLLEPDFELVRLDLAGFGKSQQPPAAWGLSDYAQYVTEFAAKLGIEPFAVIGHSNGGAVAAKAVAMSTLKVEKLVLLSSAGIRDTMGTKKLVLRTLTKTGKLATIMLPADLRRKLRAQLYGSVGSDMLIAPHMEQTFKRIVGEDIQALAANISIPTLILSGSDDTATPPSFGSKFHAAIDGSSFHVIESAGHFAHQQMPKVTTTLIRDFLDS